MDIKNRITFGCIFLAGLLLSTTAQVQAQSQTVTGTVTDEQTQEVLPGVNILVKGTTTGASTDADGHYELNVPSLQDTLIFTYIGYQRQQVPVNGRVELDVQLNPEAIMGEEMVVVGYGTQKKSDLTGSVSSVDGAKLETAPTPNLTNNLTGKLTGVVSVQQSGQPGSDDAEFFIRGKSTFGNNSPLILVDGIERNFSRIDPNTIESVTVLKDAASAAVYGARAANGVILVTTKSGAAGDPTISYNGSVGFETPAYKPEMMNGYQYAKYFRQAQINQGQNPEYTEADIAAFKNGERPTTDWWGAVMSDQNTIQQHNVSVSGGTERINYFASVGMLNQNGMYKLSSYDKYNVRANIDAKITKDLSVNLRVAGRKDKTSQSPDDNLFTVLLQSRPTFPAYLNVDGEKVLGYNGINVNPIGDAIRSGYERDESDVFEGKINLKYDFSPVKGLSGELTYAFDQSETRWKQFEYPYEFYVHDNQSDQYSEFKSMSKIKLEQDAGTWHQETFRVSLNYSRQFEKNDLSGLVLFEQSEEKNESIGAYREGFISNSIDQIFAGSNTNKNNSGTAFVTARRGFVGRVNYSYDDKYLLQANARYDGSYNFSDGNRWGLFPAFSAGWAISEEPFMENVEFFENLKVRASWGQYGNDRIDPYQYLAGFNINQNLGHVSGINRIFNSTIEDTGIPNRDVTWETATNTNIGIDFSIMDGRISGEADYFTKRTEDILMYRNASIPETFGAELPQENIGVVDNYGFEGLLRYREQFGDWSLQAEGNVTFAKSEVEFIDEPKDVADRIRRTGRPLEQMFGYEAMGLFQSQEEIDNWADQDGRNNESLKPGDIKYKDINNDGVIDGFDIHKIGKSTIPETVFGFNLSVNYKGLSLTTNFQGATGFSNYHFFNAFSLKKNTMTALTDSWSPDNKDAAYPRMYVGQKPNNSLYSSFWAHDGTYLKLRNAELAYTVPQWDVLERVGLQRLRLSLSGNNLLTFSKYDVLDPEAPSADGNPLYYPQMKSVYFGMNIQF